MIWVEQHVLQLAKLLIKFVSITHQSTPISYLPTHFIAYNTTSLYIDQEARIQDYLVIHCFKCKQKCDIHFMKFYLRAVVVGVCTCVR